jgi:hypothetical protein
MTSPEGDRIKENIRDAKKLLGNMKKLKVTNKY